LKQLAVKPVEIHRRLLAVYGENTVNRTIVYRWVIKFRECDPGCANIVDRCNTQKQTAGTLGMSIERVGYIIGLLCYTKVCS